MSLFLRPSRAAELLVALLLLCPRGARAEDSKKAACASAYEKSQELRASGKLSGARESLVICAQDGCPAFVQTDCSQWLTEVQKEMPTIVISVKDTHGDDTGAVRVTVDGEQFLTELDGKAVPIDPGMHKFRFELEGAAPIDQQILIKQGQKDRSVDVSFAQHTTPDVPEESPYTKAAAADAKPADSEDTGKPGKLRPYAYVAGGVGGAGILGWVIFGALGNSKKNTLNSTCAPHCAQSEVDSVKTQYLLADVSLGVGIVGIGTGVALFILSMPKGKPAASDQSQNLKFDVRTAPGSAYGTVSGQF